MEFSVIIPLFNKRASIGCAIQSVLNQTHREFKLFVVNDGSTDGGEHIAKKFADPRVRVVDQPNRGEAAARNTGIRAATSTHVAFLDADDCWKPEFLSLIQQLIDRHPAAAIYGTGIEAIEEDGTRSLPESVERFIDMSGRLDYPSALARWVFPLSSSSVSVPIGKFGEVGLFDERLKLATDIDMWVRLCLSGPAYFDRRIGATYHKDALCRSTTVQSEFWDKRLFFVDVLHERLQAPGIALRDRRNLERFLAQVTYEALVAKANADREFNLGRAMRDRKQHLTLKHSLFGQARRFKYIGRGLFGGVP